MRWAYQTCAKRKRHVLRTRGIHFFHQAFATLIVILTFFKRNPFRPTYFSSTAKKSRQKKPRSGKYFPPILSELSRPA
jgi:hypothetical protein